MAAVSIVLKYQNLINKSIVARAFCDIYWWIFSLKFVVEIIANLRKSVWNERGIYHQEGYSTVWKFRVFCITQILWEIKFVDLGSAKSTI